VTNAHVRPGVWFQGGLHVRVATDLGVRAEAAGVDSIWVAEGPVARDAFVTLCSLALATSRVELATGVVNPFTRHPAQLAATFASLDELSAGRAVCGLGIGARDGLIPLGADVSKPLTAARETVEIIRRLLAREAVVLDGTVFQLDLVRLGFRPVREVMPLYLAATGPKMCALAGAVADGIYLMYGTENYVRKSLALSLAARTSEVPFRVASPILMGVVAGDDSAKAGLKVGIGLMLTEPNGESMLEANGIEPVHAQRIRDGLSQGGIKGLIAAVDESIVERLTIFGSHGECVERLEQAVAWGINEPQILLTGDDPTAVLAVLADLRAKVT
jgi:5,10-methylenetetrahydromethanopterin reductase